MPRGGRRAGSPGGQYSNRTDLAQQQNKVPAMVAPGQPYGARQAELDAQRTLPVASSPVLTPPGGSPVPVGAGGAAQPFAHTSSPMGDLDRPSERPDEHVMHGNIQGPGGGPDAMPAPAAVAGGDMSQMLQQVAQHTGDPAISALANTAMQRGI